MQSTGGGNSQLLQYSCHENPMNSPKRQKDKIRKMSTPGQKLSNMLLGKIKGQLLTALERMKPLGQIRNDAQLWMCLVVKLMSSAEKNNIA